MSLPISSDKDKVGEYSRLYAEERNSLRKFLAGIVAATFGVLVALHPTSISTMWTGWLYIGCIVANALSLIFLMFSTFGRYFGLRNMYMNEMRKVAEDMTGMDLGREKSAFPLRFKWYTVAGIISYIVAIVLSCAYIVLEIHPWDMQIG